MSSLALFLLALDSFFLFWGGHVPVFFPRAQGSVWPDKPRTRFPCLDASTGRVKNVLLPPLLLETAIALLSFHRADANPTPELQVRDVM